MGTITALLLFSFLVFFHELGHFVAARFFSVQVDVFSIGFGKRLFTKKFGQTEWSISAIPLGGYVRMKGQDDADPSKISYDHDSYYGKKPWERIIINLAGPFANFLLAFLLYLTVASIGVPKLLSTVGSLNVGYPAHTSGIEVGDQISAINGKPIHYWEEMTQSIKENSESLNITLLRKDKYIEVNLKPKLIEEKNMFGEPIKRYVVGIGFDSNQKEYVPYALDEGLDYAYERTKAASLYIAKSLKKLVTGDIPLENLGGVIGIAQTTAKVSHMGLTALLLFMALISINLGIINLLPIPALDGGHVMFNLYELITNKAPNEDIMLKLTLMGWALLLSLMLIGFYNDIVRY